MRQNYLNLEIKQTNGIICAFFLFQYSLLIPLMHFMGSDIVVALFGIALLIILFLCNKKIIINKTLTCLFLTVCALIFLKILVTDTTFNVLIEYCLIALPVVLLYSFEFDINCFFKAGYYLAIINFFLLCWIPFFLNYNYMRFGYGMVLSVIFFLNYLLFAQKKVKMVVLTIVLFVFSFAEMAIFGARGCLVVFVVYAFLSLFLINKKHILRNTIIIIGCVAAFLNLYNILSFIQGFLDKIGVGSYSIRKYIMGLEEGLVAASSSRNIIYKIAVKRISERPFFGNAISIGENGDFYIHNIFLQVWNDFGIFALIILVLFLLYVIYLLLRNDVEKKDKALLAILFSVSIGRLLFSSVLWKRPEFWMLVCFTIVVSIRKKNKNNNIIQLK